MSDHKADNLIIGLTIFSALSTAGLLLFATQDMSLGWTVFWIILYVVTFISLFRYISLYYGQEARRGDNYVIWKGQQCKI